MFGNNAFGALGVEESQQAGPSRKQIQGEEIDVDWLQLVKTNYDVNVRVSDKVNLEGLPLECNLMAVSNRYGVLLVGSSHEVRIHRLTDVHRLLEDSARDASPVSEPAATIHLPGRPIWIRLAAEETKLVVTTATTAQVFGISDVLGGNLAPSITVSNGFPEQVLDLLPNPAAASDALARHVAVVTGQGLALLDLEDGKLTATVQGQLTCASWSAKGKQVVCGERSGKLVQYTPDGTAKAEILPPPELAAEFYPTSVEWLENDLFLVSYKNGNGDDDEPLSVFVIHRNKEEVTYTEFFDPLNTMGLPSRSSSHRAVASLKQWGDQTRHLSFMLSGKSSEVAILRGKPAAGKEAPSWEALILEETARGVMPTGKKGVSEDSSCIGLELDLTSTKVIKMGIVGGVEVPDLPPTPRLLAYSQEGFIVSFDVRYPEAGAYPNMVVPQEPTAPTAEANMESAPAAPEPAASKPAFGGFGGSSSPSPAFGTPSPSAFGTAAPSSSGGFGQSAFGKPAAAGFGQSAFGQPAAASSSPFGQSSSSTPAFGQTGFGQKTETKPAFGHSTSTSTGSAFGQASTGSAFGKPAFGSSSTSSAFGQTGFGQSASPASTPAASTSSAFGKTGFGQSTTPASPAASASAFGKRGFGQTSTPAFGASAFGLPSTPAKNPFGQTSSTTPSTTPAASPAPAFGQTAFGQKPASTPSGDSKPTFAQSSSPTAFGQSAFGQPSKPAAPATASAFGKPSSSTSPSAFGSVPSTGGFAGFGAKTSSSGSGFGGSAFGQPSTISSGSSGSNSPFGSGGAVKSGSAFGSSSGFGQGAFGSRPTTPSNPFAMQSSESKAETKDPEPKAESETKKDSPATAASATKAPESTGGFGLGGLGSALESSKSTREETENESLFGPTSKSTAQEPSSTSPPDSPVLGASRTADLSDDETSTPKPAFTSTPSSTATSNSFIKPATAFGTSSKFGQPTTTPSAAPAKPTTTTGTPNAFSKPVPTTPTASASGFGSTGFGSFAFGKPAASAFGAAAKPAPVGNISGGFGGFAAKSPSTTSGFAGFGAKSAFGGASAGGSFASLLSGDKKESGAEKPEQKESSPQPDKSEKEAEEKEKVEPIVEVKEEPKEPEAVPVGYDVPAPVETEAVEEQDIKPDITAEAEASTSPSTTPPAEVETEKHSSPCATPPPQDENEGEKTPSPTSTTSTSTSPPVAVESRAGSSPEMVEHGDSASEGEDEHEDPEGEEYDEEANDYDEDEEEEENYDQYEGEHEEYGDEEYDEEDEEPYSGEGEGSDDEGEDEDEEQQVEQPSPTDQSAAVEAGSLFSRLGPPQNPSFFGKHAARTSSPLGTQPPQNAESSTPPGTPPKPPARDASSAAPPPFFGFGKPEAPKATPALSFGIGLGKPSAPASPAPPPVPAPAPPTETKPEIKQPEKSLFSGFGLGKPPAQSPAPAPAPAPQPFLSFNKPASSTPPIAAAAPSLFGKAPATPSAPPASAPSAASTTPANGKFAIPTRTPVKESPQAQDDGSRQMASVMQRMIADLVSEINTMKEALATHAEYHRGLEPKYKKISLDDLENELPFSSLSDIAAIIDQLSAEMSEVGQKDKTTELRVMELQSRMLKTDMKVKQVEKLVEAHDDATYAYHSRNQDLSPRQVNSRVQLRRRTQSVESKLDDLDRSVRRLKQSESDSRPTVENLQSSLREVESAIAEKQDLIEDLSMRVKSIRLSTPGARRAPTVRQARSGINKVSTLEIPSEISAAVERATDREEKFKLKLKVKTARLTRASSSTAAVKIGGLPMPGNVDISSFIRKDEPVVKVEVEEIPEVPTTDMRTQAKPATSPAPVPVAAPAAAPSQEQNVTTPSPFSLNISQPPNVTAPVPSPSFGGFTLSLDPGDISSSHNRQRGITSGARSHHAAPKLNLSAGSGSPSDGTTSPVKPMSFFPPPGSNTSPSLGAGGDGKSPKGFFSLSGFGQK